MAKAGKQPARQEPRLDGPATDEPPAQATRPAQQRQAGPGRKPSGQKKAGQRQAGASHEPPPEIAARVRMPQIRLLPVLIFVLALMLSVRGNDFWTELSSVSLTTASVAQQPPQPGKASKTANAAPPAPAQPPAAAPAPAAPAAAPAPAAPAASAPAQTPAPVPPPPEGEQSFTQNEIDLLQKLAERREGLDGRAKELDMREGLLRAAEGRIDKKIAEMQALQGTIEGLLKKYNEQEDAKMRSLVKVYENMKPKDAAKIFEQLDMPILLSVVEGMKEQKFAPILAEMDPIKAKAVTSELAQRRQLPPPSTVTSGG